MTKGKDREYCCRLLLSIRMSLDLTFPETSFYFLFAFRYFPSSMEQIKWPKVKRKLTFHLKILYESLFILRSII